MRACTVYMQSSVYGGNVGRSGESIGLWVSFGRRCRHVSWCFSDIRDKMAIRRSVVLTFLCFEQGEFG